MRNRRKHASRLDSAAVLHGKSFRLWQFDPKEDFVSRYETAGRICFNDSRDTARIAKLAACLHDSVDLEVQVGLTDWKLQLRGLRFRREA